jgi:hypothetical protein
VGTILVSNYLAHLIGMATSRDRIVIKDSSRIKNTRITFRFPDSKNHHAQCVEEKGYHNFRPTSIKELSYHTLEVR